ncbi:hypothetical protein F4677DRAFT_384684 [Hypoxylon crocopeplum]|nr:hypothetical protein F4677DRAFT_384684 [Hypoxylon crocopeplum]
MPSYVITGVSKGLGFEFLRQISNDPKNTVIGLVRDKPTTDKKVAEELKGRSNVYILKADITDYDALKNAAAEATRILGGRLDYLVANAAFVSTWDAFDPIGVLANTPKEMEEHFNTLMKTNVLSNIYLFNLFMPLILKGQAKKVITISSGMADMDMVNRFDIEHASLYATSKAAMNMVTAKFNAQYKKDGVLFLGICPGMVDVGHYKNATPDQLQALGGMTQKFSEYAPHFTGPATPEDSIQDVMSVWERCSVDNGDGGAFISHKGNKQWL